MPKKLAILFAYFLIYVVWGSTYYFIGVALHGFPTFLLGALRFSTAGLILLVICACRGERVFIPRLVGRSAVSGIILLFIDMAVVMLAQRYVSSSLVAVVASSTAIWIMTLDAPMWKYTFRSKCTLAGILMGFAGVGLLYAEQLEMTVTVHDHSEYGILLLVAGCISWALGTLYTKYRSSDTEPANAFAGSAWQMLFAGMMFWICTLGNGEFSLGIQYGPSIRLVVIGLSDTVRLADGLFRLRMAAEDPPDNGSGHPCLRESCGGCRYRWRAGRGTDYRHTVARACNHTGKRHVG